MRQSRGRIRRAAILRAARELFSRHGRRGTSIAAIAEKVGITDAGLLYHFPTKNELLLAVLEETDREQEGLMAGDSEAADARYISSWSEFGAVLEDEPVLMALDVLMSAEHLQTSSRFNQYFTERYQAFRDRIGRSFENGRKERAFNNDFDPKMEAALMIAVLDGLRLQWLLSKGDISMAKAMRYYVQRLEERVRA
jgi:AcrR family transcriptional regulator